MRRVALGVTLAALMAVLPACGDDDDGEAATAEQATRSYTVGYTSAPGLGDLHTFLAWDELLKQDIEVRPRFFSDHDVLLQALIRGDIDFATNIATDPVLFAVNAGQPLKIITGYTGPEFLLAGRSELSGAEDLVGQRVGVHTVTGGSGAWVRAYLEANDVNADDVDIIAVPGSGARAQALLENEIDAASVGQVDLLFLEQEAPGKFASLVEFGAEFGGTGIAATVVTDSFIEENPDDLQAIVTAMIETSRAMSGNPELAVQQAPVYLGSAYEDLTFLFEAVELYIEKALYPVDGALSTEVVDEYMTFTRERNPDFEGFDFKDRDSYYDFQFVEAALDELGDA